MKKSIASNKRITFGKRKGRRPRKTKGPKDKAVSKYRGQGKV